jgi:hypothetical protein
MPIILATQEAEIRRIVVSWFEASLTGKIVCETLLKNPFTKKGWWSGSGVGPKFKHQY